MFNNTPAPHGATKGPSRDEAEGRGKTYVFQPYPSVRYHPDGSTKTVHNEAEDISLGEPWGKKFYPAPAKPLPPPEPTLADLKVKVVALETTIAELTAAKAALAAELDKAATDRAELQAFCDERVSEIFEFRSARKQKPAAKAE